MLDFGPGPSFPGGGGGFDMMITIVPVITVIGFVILIGTIIYRTANRLRNEHAAQENTYVRIAAKRMEVRSQSNHHQHDNHVGHSGSFSRTYYYITLEFDNGSRREYLDINGLYGLVVEGDSGYAATKGDWIVAFERSAG